MNKEIKFRAWDKNRKSMIDWFTMSQSTWNKGVTTLMYDILVSNKMNFDLMQYTGLKDKHGKEIYEGDILKGINDNPFSSEHDRNYKVIWGVDSWHIEKTYFSLQELFNFCNNNIEVIGNIYKNPELLK